MADEHNPEVPAEIKPCRHMEAWVNALSDGSLSGPARWYTQLHVAGCKQCRAALSALQRLREHLQALRSQEDASLPTTLAPHRRQSLEAALDEVEKNR